MAQKFLTDIEVTRGLVDSSGDLGVAGQVLSSTGTGTNWITNESNSTVVYLDEFTGDNSTVGFTLSVSVTDENITQVYIDGVYQNKNTYSVSNTTLTFSTAPPLNADIEVITFSTATTADDLQAGVVIIPVKNTHTASIAKGQPVYITGNVGASARLQIAPADASNSAKMPAAGLLLQTLAVNAEGYVVTGGYLRNITTDIIDGTSTSSNDTVYVKSGGGLTMTKPTGTNLIQNIAKVARSSGGSSGSLLVSSILRTNDVPNITNDYFWLGNSSGVATATEFTSSVRGLISTSGNALSYNSTTGVITSNYEESPTFTGNVTINGFFTSRGIDDNADATAITINGNEEVGIGTTSPTYRLHVAGTTAITGNLTMSTSAEIRSSDGTGIRLRNAANSANEGGFVRSGLWEGDSSRDPSLFAETGLGLRFYTGGSATERMLINSSGNVGIGATDPVKKLDVRGQLAISNSASSYWYLDRNDSTGNFEILTDTNSSVFNIDTSENVGIGTTLPTQKLEVAGNIAIHNSTNAPFIDFVESGATSDSKARITMDQIDTNNGTLIFSTEGSGTLTERMRIDSSGLVRIQKNTASTTEPLLKLSNANGSTTDGVKMIFEVANTSGNGGEISVVRDSGSFNPYMTFNVSSGVASAPTERMRIDSDGNVGVSYTGPYNQISGGETTLAIADADNAALYLKSNAAGGHNHILFSGTGGGLSFYDKTRGDYNMVIDSSGNVGIGTTSPNAKLKIEGDGATNGLSIKSAGNGGTYPFMVTWSGGTEGDTFCVDDNLNVGIGTTSPSALLDFGTSIQDNKIHLYASGNDKYGMGIRGSQLLFYSGGQGLGSGGITFGKMTGTTYTENMRVTNDGNVGIGNTSPIAQLDVAGNTNQHHSVSTTHNGGWKNIQNLGAAGWLDQTYSAGRLKVFGYENGSVNISYCEYYVIRHNSGYSLNQIGTRLSVGNGHGQVDVQISGNFLQVKNALNSSLGVARVVFSGMKD